jgi:hypothetical protein
MHTVTIILIRVLPSSCAASSPVRAGSSCPALIQIAGGTGLAMFGVQVPLDPDIFFLLFIPPCISRRLAHSQGRLLFRRALHPDAGHRPGAVSVLGMGFSSTG